MNYEAGAQTPLSAVFSALFLVAILLAVAPLAAFLPLATMAALLFVVAWGLLDFAEMRRIARTSRGDSFVIAVTFVSTLTFQLEFAIFVGVLASLLVYLNRTTHPRLTRVAPDPRTPQRRFVPQSAASALCPQLDILRIDGSLFFGAVEHVRDELEAERRQRPAAREVLLVGSGVNFIDVAGCEFLIQAARYLRDTGGTLYLCNLKPDVYEALERGGFLESSGAIASGPPRRKRFARSTGGSTCPCAPRAPCASSPSATSHCRMARRVPASSPPRCIPDRRHPGRAGPPINPVGHFTSL